MLSLADLSITTAITGSTTTPLTDLDGVSGLSVWIRFAGTGGTSVDVWLQQSPDQGGTWCDIANVHLTASGVAQIGVVHGAAAMPTVTDGTLSANTVLNSGVLPLFDRYRLKVTSVGTWTAGLLTARLIVRY